MMTATIEIACSQIHPTDLPNKQQHVEAELARMKMGCNDAELACGAIPSVRAVR